MRMLAFLCAIALLLGCNSGENAPDASLNRSDTKQTHLVSDTDETVSLFEAVMTTASEEAWHEKPLGEIMQVVGTQFLGKPYEAGLLDQTMEETLVVELSEYDCVTYVESVLAMSRGIAAEDYSYEGFTGRLSEQRYRQGVLDGYCSRLHYFTEWIADNDGRGTVQDLSQELGGERLDKQLTFMTENRDSYQQLAASDSLFNEMRNVETELVDHTIYHIPEDRIHEVYDRLQPGDVLALATDIDGLDVTHTGLVYRGDDDAVGLLHASLTEGVVVSPDLQTYVQNNPRQVGIVVARPSDPRTEL